jgi:hypothetical protein
MHAGYRRAGFALEKGENTLEVTEEQFAQLNDDPNVAVQVNDPLQSASVGKPEPPIDAPLNTQSQQDIELNVAAAPEELIPWLEKMIGMSIKDPLIKKPNCDHLTINVDGQSLTPSANERDAAWAWYQANLVAPTDDSKAGE